MASSSDPSPLNHRPTSKWRRLRDMLNRLPLVERILTVVVGGGGVGVMAVGVAAKGVEQVPSVHSALETGVVPDDGLTRLGADFVEGAYSATAAVLDVVAKPAEYIAGIAGEHLGQPEASYMTSAALAAVAVPMAVISAHQLSKVNAKPENMVSVTLRTDRQRDVRTVNVKTHGKADILGGSIRIEYAPTNAEAFVRTVTIPELPPRSSHEIDVFAPTEAFSSFWDYDANGPIATRVVEISYDVSDGTRVHKRERTSGSGELAVAVNGVEVGCESAPAVNMFAAAPAMGFGGLGAS